MRNFNKNNLLHVLALFQLHSTQHPSVPVYIQVYMNLIFFLMAKYMNLINIVRTQINVLLSTNYQ